MYFYGTFYNYANVCLVLKLRESFVPKIILSKPSVRWLSREVDRGCRAEYIYKGKYSNIFLLTGIILCLSMIIFTVQLDEGCGSSPLYGWMWGLWGGWWQPN